MNSMGIQGIARVLDIEDRIVIVVEVGPAIAPHSSGQAVKVRRGLHDVIDDRVTEIDVSVSNGDANRIGIGTAAVLTL